MVSVILILALLLRVSEGGVSHECLKCQQEVKTLKNKLFNQLTQGSTVGIFDIICGEFPENERLGCVQNVASYAIPVLTQMESIDTEAVCAAIGRCPDDAKLPPLSNVSLALGNAIADLDLRYRGMFCAVCTTTLSFIHNILSDKSVQLTLRRVLMRLCYFTGPLRTTCISFLSPYGSMFIDLAVAQLTPKLCTTLHLCGSVDTVQANLVSSGIFCSVCKRITSAVHFLVQDKDNEERAIALAKYMCKRLPSPINTVCDTLASFAVPLIFDYLRNNIQMIDNLCKILGFCPKQALNTDVIGKNQLETSKQNYQKLLFLPKLRKQPTK